MWYVWFPLGLFLGVVLCIFFLRKKPSGIFVIDFSDPMGESFKLEWYENLNRIYTKKKIVLDVKVIEVDSLN